MQATAVAVNGHAGHAGPPRPVPQGNEQLVEARATLRTFWLPPHGRQRVTLVIDSIAKGSLFGGAGTALILAALLANRRGADLRVVTRTQVPAPAAVDDLWRLNGIHLDKASEFIFAPRQDGGRQLDLLPDELFVTTSWWTTAATLPAVPACQIVYLLQEDERMFYLFGDVRLCCENVFRERGIRFVVNTHGLLQHLVADGLQHMTQQACSFEPAFPPSVYHPRPKPPAAKRKFLFYARPLNPRNLFFLGCEVIEAAIERGVLRPDEWDFVFLGRDIPELPFPGGCVPRRLENLSWAEYAQEIGSADLGLSLMYTPHPSYPPLDMAASGAVVVTNRCGLKQDLSPLCANILCCEPNLEALVQGLADAAALARDVPRRDANFQAHTLARDWHQALAGVVEQMAGRA